MVFIFIKLLSRDVTNVTFSTLASPLELTDSVVGNAYEYTISQFQNLLHFYHITVEHLKKIHGNNLTQDMVQDYFQLNPFLDEVEYYNLEHDLLNQDDPKDDDFSSSFGQNEDNLDDRLSTSSGLYQEDLDHLSNHNEKAKSEAEASPLWKATPEELKDFQKELDKLHDEKERALRSNTYKARILQQAKLNKGDGKIKAFREPEEDSDSDNNSEE